MEKPIMAQQLRIADHNGCNLNPREENEWPVFNDAQEYCGQIWLTASWAVPARIHEKLGLPNHIDLYLSSVGHWAPTLEQAEHYLANTAAPTEFRLKGASLGLFFPLQWAEDNGIPNTYSDYRVFRHSEGYWDAEKIEPTIAIVGVAEPF
jgi:hypothetical protein